MSQFLYQIARPFIGLIWRVLRLATLWKLRKKYFYGYTLVIYKHGNGIHYKWLFTSRRSGKQYLVKTTNNFIEWWHRSVLEYKKRRGFHIDYECLDFQRIVKNLQQLTAIPTLKSLTLLERIDVFEREIWYRFLHGSTSIDVNNPEHIYMQQEAKKKLLAHGFRHGDDRPDNYLIHFCPSAVVKNIYVIDLESIIQIKN